MSSVMTMPDSPRPVRTTAQFTEPAAGTRIASHSTVERRVTFLLLSLASLFIFLVTIVVVDILESRVQDTVTRDRNRAAQPAAPNSPLSSISTIVPEEL